jgi:hypothetical protein
MRYGASSGLCHDEIHRKHFKKVNGNILFITLGLQQRTYLISFITGVLINILQHFHNSYKSGISIENIQVIFESVITP